MSTKKLALYAVLPATLITFYLLSPSSEVIIDSSPDSIVSAESQSTAKSNLSIPAVELDIPKVLPKEEEKEKPPLMASTDTAPAVVPRNSLEKARLYGDPRTPPIERSKYKREMPTEEELEDPDLYQEYEARQNQKVYKSFYKESAKKLTQMEKIMNKARQEGVSEEDLREGDEKIAAMKAMRKKLEAEHDDLDDE